MRIEDIFNQVVQSLRAAGIEDADTEAAAIFCHFLDLGRAELYLAAETKVGAVEQALIGQAVTRRSKREPLAYILGQKEFWSLRFAVSNDVLIPRPETELLVEKVLLAARDAKNSITGPVLDLGVGSGVISVVLALELPHLSICAVDISLSSLQVARQNIADHGVAERVQLIQSDWFSALGNELSFDLIVANPPYVAGDILALPPESTGNALQPEVSLFEPQLALDGGENGLEQIDRIITALPHFLKSGGWFFMEIGADQGQAVKERFMAAAIYDQIAVYPDYAGLPRILQARKMGES